MDGIIIVNKPKGITSHDVVYRVKKIFKEKVDTTSITSIKEINSDISKDDIINVFSRM